MRVGVVPSACRESVADPKTGAGASGSNAPTLFGDYSRVVPTPALDDRYGIESGRILLTGVQAMVRLPFDQLRRAGLPACAPAFVT